MKLKITYKTAQPQIITISMALIIGLIYLLPHLILSRTTQNHLVYYPFSFSELVNAFQVREILDGHILIGDPQLFEHKNTFPPIFPYLPPLLLSILSVATGSIVNAFLVSDFIFPALLFLVLVALSKKMTNNLPFAIFSSTATLTIYQLTTKIPPISPPLWQALIGRITLTDVSIPLPFYRTPNPQITYLVLAIALWSLFLLWLKPSTKLIIATSILGVLLFSTHFYPATYFVFTVASLTAVSLLLKDFNRLKPLFFCSAILLITALVYNQVSSFSTYQTIQVTSGKFYARYIDWLFTARYGVVLILTVLAFRKLRLPALSFLIALTLAALLSMNFQLLTGWTIQPGHWPQAVIEPTMVIVTTTLLFIFASKRKLLSKSKIKALLATLTVVLITYATAYQIKFATTNKNLWTIPQDANDLLLWLDQNTTSDDVVASLDPSTLVFVPVFTQANIFNPIYFYHYASLSEIWQRLLLTFKLYDIKEDNFDPSKFNLSAFALDQAYNVNKYKHYQLNEYSQSISQLLKICQPSTCTKYNIIPKSTLDSAKDTYANLNLKDNPYRLNYLITTETGQNISPLLKIERVFSSGNYSIYKLQ